MRDGLTWEFAAVVLAGGTARRLGGVDKATIRYAGRPLLEHALAALGAADPVVVVGPERSTTRAVRFVQEEPPLGGPVAGLLAGIDALGPSPAGPGTRVIGVLAVDMPHITSATFDRLASAAQGHTGAFLSDADGRRHLAGVLLADAVPRLTPTQRHGLAMRRFLADLDIVTVAAIGNEGDDVDTWADLPTER
jgi:molybdopterin-guanine dinucleotide biosynthesis protein A